MLVLIGSILIVPIDHWKKLTLKKNDRFVKKERLKFKKSSKTHPKRSKSIDSKTKNRAKHNQQAQRIKCSIKKFNTKINQKKFL